MKSIAITFVEFQSYAGPGVIILNQDQDSLYSGPNNGKGSELRKFSVPYMGQDWDLNDLDPENRMGPGLELFWSQRWDGTRTRIFLVLRA